MAKNVRISDALYLLAQAEAQIQDRSIAQQLEHWAKLGLAAASTEARREALEATLAQTRALDALDVKSGKVKASHFHFMSNDMVKKTTPAFPARYRRS